MQRTDVRTYSLPLGSYGEVLEDIFQGEVPSRLIIGFVDSEAYMGDFNQKSISL